MSSTCRASSVILSSVNDVIGDKPVVAWFEAEEETTMVFPTRENSFLGGHNDHIVISSVDEKFFVSLCSITDDGLIVKSSENAVVPVASDGLPSRIADVVGGAS